MSQVGQIASAPRAPARARGVVRESMRGKIMRRLKGEKGQSFVEFTLVLPIALVLILGVVDLGRATSYWLDSSHLANDAARYAAVNSCPGCNPSNPFALPTAIKNRAETGQLQTAT